MRAFLPALIKQRPADGYWLELGSERLELLTTGKHGAVYAEFVEARRATAANRAAAAASQWPRRWG
ncbi:Uncharacterised protein [Chromobacterium violaceum]|uniref:Uncharacterized protein n=1 Tax=Chromobacterium violaceum TaxID=536 RepID=A0A447T5T5_CHRVL|nr:Uncharacterised protein [Chromobacterium violaceum]